MSDLANNLNSLWAKLLIDELVRCGVTQFCIAPGSRSTPLVAAAARNKRVRITVHTDERGAGFFAVGYGRATGRPAAVITTSGTAVANLVPAVVESSMDHVPMILLTADRPPELRDCGANQTIQQMGMFSSYLRWQFDVPCPAPEIDPAFLLSTIDQAWYRAAGSPAGPVHLNCMYREPLGPDDREIIIDLSRWPGLTRWATTDQPFTSHARSLPLADPSAVALLAEKFSRAVHPLLVVGELRTRRERVAVGELAKRLHWPMLADISSGLDRGAGTAFLAHDLLPSDSDIQDGLRPDCCLQIGGRVTSSRLISLLAETDLTHFSLVNDHPRRQDPNYRLTDRIQSDLVLFCEQFAPTPNRAWIEWQSHWSLNSQKMQQAIDAAVAGESLTEPGICRALSRLIDPEHALFLASSMPIRYMSMYAAGDGTLKTVQSNRGASGIDGTIASAAGFATGSNRPVTLLIGDQAFLHDLNSLLLLRSSPQPVTIVLLNNDGGRIFEHLPIARYPELLNDYFVASHGLKFDQAAAQFGLPYYDPKTLPEFRDAYLTARQSGRASVIELAVDARLSETKHRQIKQAVTAMLRRE